MRFRLSIDFDIDNEDSLKTIENVCNILKSEFDDSIKNIIPLIEIDESR